MMNKPQERIPQQGTAAWLKAASQPHGLSMLLKWQRAERWIHQAIQSFEWMLQEDFQPRAVQSPLLPAV